MVSANASAGDDEDDSRPLERALTDSHIELHRTIHRSGELRALHARARAQALARLSAATTAGSSLEAAAPGSYLQPRKAEPIFHLLTEALAGKATSSTSDDQFLSELSVGDYIDVDLSEMIAHFTKQLDTKKAEHSLGASAQRANNTHKKGLMAKPCRHGAACRRCDCCFEHPAERTPVCPAGLGCRETDRKHRQSYLHPPRGPPDKNRNRKQPQFRELETEPASRSERAQPAPQDRWCLARVSAIAGDLSQVATSKLLRANQPRQSSSLTLHVELIGSGGPATEMPEIVWLCEELETLVGRCTPKGWPQQRKTQQVMAKMLQQLQLTRQPAITLTVDGEDLLRKVVFRPLTGSADPLSALAVGDEVEV